jgi:3-deoxy-D-manno-octulosonic-acid transferase
VILRLYSLLMWALQPWLRNKLARRAASEPAYGQQVEERFGHYAQARPQPRSLVWVHAVSLGETRAAAVLVQHLRMRQPGLRLLLTHSTATGREEGRKLLRQEDVQAWLPWDTQAAVHAFLAHFQPKLGILMETEVWPNLAAACQARQVPLVLANARLNARSAALAHRLAWLARPAYGSLAQVWAQTPADAERLAAVGAKVNGVIGNLKFDANPDATQRARALNWRHGAGPATQVQGGAAPQVLMLASSREGEEEAFARGVEVMASRVQQAGTVSPLLLVVPRHPQRFDAVASLLTARGWQVWRRSQAPADWPSAWSAASANWNPASDHSRPTVVLGDSVGEMALYYSLADVALLGGSFEPLGGQNLIEAAANACPIVMGPHTFNFAEAAQQALEAGAAQRTTTMDQGIQAAWAWLQDPTALRGASQKALAFSTQHQGAAQRLVEGLAPLL